jgi:hypothetical protein
LIVAQAKRAAFDAQNAGRAAADDLQHGASSQAQFLQASHMGAGSNELADLCNLAGAKSGNGREFTHRVTASIKLRMNLNTWYRLILTHLLSNRNW